MEEFHQEGIFLSPSSLKYFFDQSMNISPHLLIDAIILSGALTITLLLRAKGNTVKEQKESKWLLKRRSKNSKNLNYLEFGIFLFMEVL